MKHYHFSLGNSTDGPVGYCASIRAPTKREAVARLKMLLPEYIDVEHDELGPDEYITIYLNDRVIKPANIDEVEEVS